MVTKGYIVHVYDEDGKRLDDDRGTIQDPTKAAQADVWLPIFDDGASLSASSTIGRAELAVIPHTKIPLAVQINDKKSAVICAIQDFDLSTLCIIGYLGNKNNDELAPFASMHLDELEINSKTRLHGGTLIELSKRACEINRLKMESDSNSGKFVSQNDLEALYGVGADTGVKNIQKAFSSAADVTRSIASATGLYSIDLNNVGATRMRTPTINLSEWAYQLETYNVTYTFRFNSGSWVLFKGIDQQGASFTDISTYGVTLKYKALYSTPAQGTEISVTFNSAIPVTSGGTGGTTAAQARENLGIFTNRVISKSEFNSILSSSYTPNTIFYIYD